MAQPRIPTAGKLLFQLCIRLVPELEQLRQWYFNTYLPKLNSWAQNEGNQGVTRMRAATAYVRKLMHEPEADFRVCFEPTPYLACRVDGTPLVVADLVDWYRRQLGALIPNLGQEATTLPSGADFRSLNKVIFTIINIPDLYPGIATDKGVERDLDLIRTIWEFRGDYLEELRDALQEIRDSFPDQVRSLLSQPLSVAAEDLDILSFKRGPQGSLTESAHLDYKVLSSTPTSIGLSLGQALQELQSYISKFMLWETKSSDHLCGLKITGEPKLPYPGRVSFKPEKSGKTRLIALPDYFSQVTFKPLHEILMRILRRIPTDCTYNQRSAIPKIQSWHKAQRFVASYDQSKCTDRFPLDFQLVVLDELIARNFLPKEEDRQRFVELVRTCFVDRDWAVRLPKSGRLTTVRWGTGQPLGMYGSWALMALSHHVLVQLAAYRVNKQKKRPHRFFSQYVICGDDIVIASEAVGKEYISIAEGLGMVINQAKSFISPKGSKIPVSEFTKKLVVNGYEIEKFSAKQALNFVSSSRTAVPLLQDLAESGVKLHVLRKIIEDYGPGRSIILTALLTIPLCLGGVGLKDDKSLGSWFKGDRQDEIHPWLYFLGAKIRNLILRSQRKSKKAVGSAIDALGRDFRLHPLVEALSSLDKTPLGHMARDKVGSIPEMVLDLLLSQAKARQVVEIIASKEKLDLPWIQPDREEQRDTLEIWSRALSRPHYLPKDSSIKIWGESSKSAMTRLEKKLTSLREYQLDRLVQLVTVLSSKGKQRGGA